MSNAYPETSVNAVSNLYTRMMNFSNKGDTEPGHSHVYDHLTLLAAGSLKVTVEGKSTEFRAPHSIYIQKDKQHELVALEDNTLAFCIFALKDINGFDLLDPESVPKGVDPLSVAQNLLHETKE